MIRVSLSRDGKVVQGGAELIDEWGRDKSQQIWIDVVEGTREEIEPLLETKFHFHALAAEDALSENALPKYDHFNDYDFLVVRALNFDVVDHGVESIKVACFLGASFLFTIHAQRLGAVEAVWERCPMDTRLLDRGADFLLYNVLDLMVDNHFPILDQIEDRIDEIHDYIFDSPSPRLLDELLHLKRDLNIIRRYSIPQRELFNQISRGDLQFVKRDHLIYFRDIYDHMFRISESIDVERDLTATSMDAYLSVIANRTNETMKVLTIISTILLPMNFIASIYGMNFLHIPELQWKYGYLFALIVMGTIGFGFLMWFARKGWLWPSRSEQIHKERALRKLLRRKGRPGANTPNTFGPRPPLDRASGTSTVPESERRRYARKQRKQTK